MFTNVKIKNFRTFGSFRAGDFQRVNIITGRNGTGKTALLEALFLNAGATNTGLAVSLSIFRGSNQIAVNDEAIFRNLFHRLSYAFPIEISAEWQTSKQRPPSGRALQISPITAPQASLGTSSPREIVKGLEFSFRGSGTKTSAKIQWIEEAAASSDVLRIPGTSVSPSALPQFWTSAPGGEPKEDAEPPLPLFVDEAPTSRKVVRLSIENPRTTALVPANFVLARFYDLVQQLHQQLVDAAKAKRIDEIVSIMRLVDPRVTAVVPLTERGQTNIYVDVGEANLLPLSLMGAGFFNILNLATAVSSIDNGVLLIDEIEDGIHYLMFPELARSILALASTKPLQLFITTHSDEIINAFSEAAFEAQFKDIAALRFLRNRKNGEVSVTSFGFEDLMSAKDVDIELR